MAATHSSLVGVQVGGKYEIRRVLGAGGMGVVCEAVHIELGKRVAIKLIDKSMKESELIVARFKREARALGQIDSEHIVDVFDVGADGRVGLFMVMEYLTGEDLQERLERAKDKKVDVRTMVMIGHQIARALVKAHAAGVVHRDLKPANVFLTQRDTGQILVKLLDFGVSKLVGDVPGDARITGVGTPVGTPLYMSPEQAEGKDDVDGRADIWSLGAVMYEALSGESAFKDRGSYHNTIIGILTSQPPPLVQVAPWVPPELAAVVDAMLVHDRDKRIPDAATVTKRLLDVFPGVLPDGTGQHTAVIVPQSSTAVDATGDTEVFNSTSMPVAISHSRPPTPQDSTATIGDYAAVSSRPKTWPLPPASSFPRNFDTVKLTPSEMTPLPQKASRSPIILLTLLLAVMGIGVGAYAAGRRARIIAPPAPATIVLPVSVVAAPPAISVVVEPAPAAVSASAAPSARPVHKAKPRPAKSAEPAPSAAPSAEITPRPELPPTLD